MGLGLVKSFEMRIFSVNSFLPNIFNRKNLLDSKIIESKIVQNKVTIYLKGNHAYVLRYCFELSLEGISCKLMEFF